MSTNSKTSTTTSVAVETLTHETSSLQLVRFTYNNNPITFKINGCVMISATNMAKPFGGSKRPNFWMNLQQTNGFLDALSKARILALADLVVVKKGGTNPGTWFHEDVALEFARWLSPEFAIWCNDRIKEILLSQNRAIPQTISYPGATIPTSCAVLDCLNSDGKKKQAYLFYGDEEWFEVPNGGFERHEVMVAMARQIAERDRGVSCYNVQLYNVKDGEFTPRKIHYAPVEKHIYINPVKNCEDAIKNYQEARAKLKTAAKKLSELKNNENF